MEDGEGFAAFYASCRNELHAALLATLADPHLARESMDEGFVRAAERWTQVRSMDRPAGWVYRVAVNWATSWRRKWSRRPTLPAEQLDAPHHDGSPDLDLVRELARLPLEQRQMMVLRFSLGYTIEETATWLDVSISTVKRGVRQARERLVDELEVTDGSG